MQLSVLFLSRIIVPIHCLDSTYPISSMYLSEFCIVPILTPNIYASSGFDGNSVFGFIDLSLSIQCISHFAIAIAFDSSIFFKAGNAKFISLILICFNFDFCGRIYLMFFIHTYLIANSTLFVKKHQIFFC